MCGSPISGPLLVIFFPVMVGVAVVDFLGKSFQSIDCKIRKNNENIHIGMHHLVKEKLLFRKQLKAESRLEGKINAQMGENIRNANNESNSQVYTDEDLARLYLQRAVTRISAQKYDQALEDIKLALYWDAKLDESHVWNFFEGVALYHYGDYLESAHRFKRGIELKSESGDSETSIELERKILDVNFEMKHTHEKVKEKVKDMRENTKVYARSWVKWLKGEEEEYQKQDEVSTMEQNSVSLFTLEEMSYRAGCSYYFATFYLDAIKCFDLAIEYGENSPNLKHYIYNKGLCYFYRNDLEEALESFNRALNLDEKFEDALKMISQTYGRKGDLVKKEKYIKLALELNPQTKLTTAFNYRLLNEEMTNLVFSFLPTYTRVSLSSTNKYWRELLMKSICNDEIFEISIRNLVNNMKKQNDKIENPSLRQKLFLPHQSTKVADQFITDVLSSSFFNYLHDKKDKRVVISCFMESYAKLLDISQPIFIPFLTDLKYLNIDSYLFSSHLLVLKNQSPNLEELIIRDEETKRFSYFSSITAQAVSFSNLKRVTFTFLFTDQTVDELLTNPLFNLPMSLEKFYFNPKSHGTFFTKFIPKFPTVEFISLTQVPTFKERWTP